MILKSIMLNERSQTLKTAYCTVQFILHSRKGKTTMTESRLVAGWGWEGRKVAKGYQGDRNVLKLDCVMGAQLCKFTKSH